MSSMSHRMLSIPLHLTFPYSYSCFQKKKKKTVDQLIIYLFYVCRVWKYTTGIIRTPAFSLLLRDCYCFAATMRIVLCYVRFGTVQRVKVLYWSSNASKSSLCYPRCTFFFKLKRFKTEVLMPNSVLFILTKATFMRNAIFSVLDFNPSTECSRRQHE